jgi:tetratricopeptide (TPR) repeat protein
MTRPMAVPALTVLILLLMRTAWCAPHPAQNDPPKTQNQKPDESQAGQGDSQTHESQQGESSSKAPDQDQADQGQAGQRQGDQTGQSDEKAAGQKPSGQKPAGDDKDSGQWSSSSSSSAAVKEPPKELPKYNPLPAEQDVDVGTYYMHKGDPDAAISRFEDAIQLKADYAKPRMLLAQIYEKKGDKANAVKYYKEYLQVYPHAPDAKKVQAKIEKLTTR